MPQQQLFTPYSSSWTNGQREHRGEFSSLLWVPGGAAGDMLEDRNSAWSLLCPVEPCGRGAMAEGEGTWGTPISHTVTLDC